MSGKEKASGKKKRAVKKSAFYKVEGASLKRLRQACPKCGPGVFMARHRDRAHCGACGYTAWNQR